MDYSERIRAIIWNKSVLHIFHMIRKRTSKIVKHGLPFAHPHKIHMILMIRIGQRNGQHIRHIPRYRIRNIIPNRQTQPSNNRAAVPAVTISSWNIMRSKTNLVS